MQAIITKYLGPTNTRGSRVKAYSEGFPHGVTVGWDYGAGNGTGLSDAEANHDRAARAFIEKHEWHGTWVRGATATGYVYVCLRRQFSGSSGCSDLVTPHPLYTHGRDILIVKRSEGGES